MKKKIFLLTCLMIIFSLFTSVIANASTTSKGSAFFMRSTRLSHNTDTQRAMSNAITALSSLNYSAQGFTDPSESLFISNVMSRNVQEYLAHGDTDRIIFDNVGLATYPTHRYIEINWSDYNFARFW